MLRTPWYVMMLGLVSVAAASAQEQLPPPPWVAAPATPVEIIPMTPPPPPPPKPWCFGLELGINGTEGNSELFKGRIGAGAKNETPTYLWTTDFLYTYAKANNVETENRGLLNSRYEWKLGDSPWSLFISGELEHDTFKAFDYRLAAHTGFAYTWLKDDCTLLKNRLGAGGSREFGGPNDDFMPEALLGLDFEYKFTARSKFCGNVDVFPDLSEWGEYRAEIRAAYELLVDPELNLTLKVGVLDRYDSTPEGRKPNDVDYFLVLLWKH